MRLYCFYRISLIALISFFLLKADAENSFDSVKIISLKNGNCVLVATVIQLIAAFFRY